MRKSSIIKLILSGILVTAMLTSCTASCSRWGKDVTSNWSGGLERVINVYSMDGKLIASHEGKVDIEDRENSILFDMDGKRYVYYNAIIEVIEK